MRTTLTIEDDVAFGIKRNQQSEPGKPFKVLINEILRRGLQESPKKKLKVPFNVRSRQLGLRKDLNFDNIEEVLDILDGVHRK